MEFGKGPPIGGNVPEKLLDHGLLVCSNGASGLYESLLSPSEGYGEYMLTTLAIWTLKLL
jgi:hypothetical protein